MVSGRFSSSDSLPRLGAPWLRILRSARTDFVLFFIIVYSAALICGCGRPAVRNLERHGSFTEEVLRSARFAVGYIALTKGNLHEFSRIEPELEDILRNRLIEHIESISLLRSGFAADVLPESSFAYLRDHFRSTGKFDEECRAIMAQAASGSVDYFIFARIDEDAVYTSQSPISNDKGEITGAYYMTTRRLGAYFCIFDVGMGRNVWSGHLSAAETIKNHYEEDESDGILGEIIEDILVGSNEPGYPDPLSMQIVSYKVFDKFARALIKQE